MQHMENSSGQRRIRCAEVDGEIERGCGAFAGWCGSGPIVISIEADVGHWNREWSQRVHFIVWTCCRLVVHRQSFHHMSSGSVICSSCANGVVGAIEGHRISRVSRPCQVFEGPDDREDLGIGVWDSVEDGVGASGVAINAAVR